MNIIRFVLQILLQLLKAITYQWFVEAIDLIKRFIETLKKFWAVLKTPHERREEEDKECCTINSPGLHRPDPCIYSQEYLMKLGLAVTWDNPDIVILQNGVPVPENALLPDTEYEIDATIWNNSYDAPAVGLKVMFSFLSFGVATVSTAIGTTFVNLGVKGGVNYPVLAKMLWKTPPVPGHYCLQVLLVWIDDANPANNMGQNNLDVVAAHSPAEFKFQLRNNTGKETRFTFEADSYTIPTPSECPTTIAREDRGPLSKRLPQIKAKHDKSNFPVPPGWAVELLPAEPSLSPNDEITVTARITPPDGFTGTKSFNVNVRYGESYAGGVTLVVSKT